MLIVVLPQHLWRTHNIIQLTRGNIPSSDEWIKLLAWEGSAAQCRSIASCVKSILLAHHCFCCIVPFDWLLLLFFDAVGHPLFRLLFAIMLYLSVIRVYLASINCNLISYFAIRQLRVNRFITLSIVDMKSLNLIAIAIREESFSNDAMFRSLG